MKPLIVSAAFTEKAATPETSYFNPGYITVRDRTITDSTQWGAQTMSFRDIINKSLNTGAVFVLKTLGGGSINDRARNIWYDYLTKHYFFAQNTGIQQSGEAAGYVPDPNEGEGLEVRYANMSFGQGLTVTPIQMIAAYNAIINGGTYYQPNIIAKTTDGTAETKINPKIVANNVISSDASNNVRQMLKESLEINNKAAVRSGYNLGAKSGTAQIAENGVYRTDLYNGAYVGYLGGDSPKYIILVRLDGPRTAGFASAEAYKTWNVISNSIIDNFAIKPKSN
jgi:cell division protein FtsI/penicillin-binding protein 2